MRKRDTGGNEEYLQTPFPSLTEPPKWHRLIGSFPLLGIRAPHPHTFLFHFFVHCLSFDLMSFLLEPNRSHQYILFFIASFFCSCFLFLYLLLFFFFFYIVVFLFYFILLFFFFFRSFLFFFFVSFLFLFVFSYIFFYFIILFLLFFFSFYYFFLLSFSFFTVLYFFSLFFLLFFVFFWTWTEVGSDILPHILAAFATTSWVFCPFPFLFSFAFLQSLIG